MERLKFPLTQKEAAQEGIQFTSEINRNAMFPTRLRELRVEKKLTQQQLADAVGATRSTIGLYENGDNVPDVKTLVKIADCLGVSYDYLLCASNCKQRENVEIFDQLGLSDDAINVLRCLALMAPAERKKYSDVAMLDILDELLSSAIHYSTIWEKTIKGETSNVTIRNPGDLFHYLLVYFSSKKFSGDFMIINSSGKLVNDSLYNRNDNEPVISIISPTQIVEISILDNLKNELKKAKDCFWDENSERNKRRKLFNLFQKAVDKYNMEKIQKYSPETPSPNAIKEAEEDGEYT